MSSRSFGSEGRSSSPHPPPTSTSGRVRQGLLKGLQKLKETVTPMTPDRRRPPSPREVRSDNLFSRKKADVDTAPRAIGSGYEYEMLSVDPAQTEHAEPLPYRFSMPTGFKQLIDPSTNLGTNTFVCGQDSPEYLALRGRMTVLDTTMSKIRQQMEYLHQELMVLETEKQDLTLKLSSLTVHDRSCAEFSISLHPPRPVEALPIAEEESHDLGRRAEATAMSELPHGGEYVVLHSSEHECNSSSARASDPAEWRAWEMHCQTGPRHVGVVVLRRKYLPDTGVRYQDVHLSMSAHIPAAPAQPSPLLGSASSDTLEKLRGIARSLHPVATKRNPLSYDRLDICGNLERLQNDEGYMQFFQRHLAAPSNRPPMSDLADKVAHAIADAVHPRGAPPLDPAGAARQPAGVVDEFEDSVECGETTLPAASLAESGAHGVNGFANAPAPAAGAQDDKATERSLQSAWQLLTQMVADDQFNGLLAEQMTEWFYVETKDQHEQGLSKVEEQRRQGLAPHPSSAHLQHPVPRHRALPRNSLHPPQYVLRERVEGLSVEGQGVAGTGVQAHWRLESRQTRWCRGSAKRRR
jgi:hypothetical protein